MATTSNTYTGNGSNKLFSITFPYLDTSDIDVYLNGTLQTIITQYTFANATTVEFVAAPANGAVILLDRSTDDSDNPATFFPGSSIKAADLNENFDQTLYVVQEINNKAVKVDDPLYANKTYIDAQDATKVNKSGDSMSGNLAMGGFKVTGLGTPSANTDAATKIYVDTVTLAGNVPDGDRGDITVSGTGTVWNIDAGAIVNADVNASAGIEATKLSFTQTGSGAAVRTVDSKLQDTVSVKDFGAVGDGVADDTIAIQTAINSSHRKAVFFPRGIYNVTDTLNITVLSYSLVGERTERGQNTQAFRSGEYSAVRINFAPIDTTKFLVNMFQATVGINIIGPFEHKNLCFTLNGANGFQFGNESLPITEGPGGQAYVHGVRFENCNFQTSGGVYGSDANGVIALTNRRHIGLAACFESVVRDCSFWDGDYGIRTFGCDKFNVTGCRAYTSRPLDFNGSGTFSVQHTVHDFQTEGWLISPLRNDGVELAVSNSRFEANVNPPTGDARFVLPTCTATVTANSATLTFSRSMDNILIPGWSLIEITDGTNTDICLVQAVSGTTVTVSTDNFRFTWSGTATTITRIHTFGPLHAPGSFGSVYTNISAGAGTNCPAFVYVGCRGSMYLTNCFAEQGTYGNIECLAVGNRASNAQLSMNGQMVLNSCTSLLTPSIPSPLMRFSNWSEANGQLDRNNMRMLGADSFDSLSKAQRKWIYTPARYQTSVNNKQSLVFKSVAGDAGTSQQVFAWFLDGTDPSGRELYIFDNTLPSATSGGLKILVRAKAVSAGTNINVTASSNLGGASIGSLAVSTNWQTYSIVLGVPGNWSSGGTTLRALNLIPDNNVYVAAVAVLDENPAADGTYVSNSVDKALAHKFITLTSGTGQVIARGSGPHSSFKVKAYGYENNVVGYATVYGEYIVQTSTYGGYGVRGVSTLFEQKHSINAGVVDLSIAITAAIVSGSVEISATATLTGVAGSTTAVFRFEIEGIGTTNLQPS
jgi:hypothetical protein